MERNISKRVRYANDLMDLKYRQSDSNNVLMPARERAGVRFKTAGIPLAKDEYWKFSSPERFTSPELIHKKKVNSEEGSIDRNTEDIHIVFLNGALDEKLSNFNRSADELEVVSMSDECLADHPWVAKLYAELEAASHKQINRPLAAFNSACATGGVFVRVKQSTKKRLVIHYRGTKPMSESIIHNLVKLEANTSLILVEKGEGACRSSRVTEIDLGSNAVLNHIRFFGNNVSSDLLTQIFVRQAFKSCYNQFSLVLNCEFIRNESFISLEGEEAKVSLSGAALATDTNLQDDTIFIAHRKRDCESRQVFKKVLKNEATGVFQGKIFVASEAQKTDGYQISKGLLLGEKSKFLTKPELEIYADDVVCSHGSTCGAIDEETLFYLMSRGVSRTEAIGMLIMAFLDEAVQEIKIDELADDIRGIIWEKAEA